MRVRSWCLLFISVALALSSSGCLAVAVGAGAAGTVAYLAGDLEAEEPYGVEQTYAAARATADGLGLRIIEGQTGRDALAARVVARDSADKKIEVRLKAITKNATKISIRVGTFGDDTKAHLIYNTIRDNLKATVVAESSTAQATADPPQAEPD